MEGVASDAGAGGLLSGATGSALEALRRHSRQIAARRVRRVQVRARSRAAARRLGSVLTHAHRSCVSVHGADAGWRERRRSR